MKIGIDLGGSHIAVGLVDHKGQVLYKKEHNFSQEEKLRIEENIVQIIVNLINEILQTNHLIIQQIELIGIGSPGAIVNGQITNTTNLNIKKLNITERLKKYFNTKIIVKNDGVCAALCEKEYGSLKQYDNCVFLCLGTGIGGACFINGALFKTGKDRTFKIGHTSIEKNGILCGCGNRGCFEKYASMKVLKSKIIERFNLEENTHGKVILGLMEEKKDDPEMKTIVQTYVADLATGISNVIRLFSPEAISIGGSFVHYKEILLPLLVKELQEREHARIQFPNILTATYENEAGIIGATIIE